MRLSEGEVFFGFLLDELLGDVLVDVEPGL